MGKQYISTVSAAQAHKLDILGVAITNKWTITVSSDGYANFWDNKQDEVHDPLEYVDRRLINKIGIHHISIYENVLPNSTIKLTLAAFTCFDGLVVLSSILNEDITTFSYVEFQSPNNCWAPGFYKDGESKQDFFLVTQADGSTLVYNLDVEAEGDKVKISLSSHGNLNANGTNSHFPVSLAVSNRGKAAVGYTNGDVILYEISSTKPVYNFHSTDLQESSDTSGSIPRVVTFTPNGSFLAVARDNQSSGTITLYDVEFGENVGSFTTPSHSSKTTIGGFAHDGWIMGLSFDDTGSFLASCGFDKCVRVWNVSTREREATIKISITDLEDTEHDDTVDQSIASGVQFIRKGARSGAGNSANEGLCVVSFDRGVRWFREAGGI